MEAFAGGWAFTLALAMLDCWRRRPQPWTLSAAEAFLRMAKVWLGLMVLAACGGHEMVDLLTLGFGLTLLSSAAAVLLALPLAGAAPPPEPDGVGISPVGS